MQFKEQNGKVAVLIYAGHDQKTGQSILKKVGSFDKYTYKPSPGLLDKLSAQQSDMLQAECDKRRQAANGLNRQHYLNALAGNIRGACDSLEQHALLSDQQSLEIWDAMEKLVKAMRKAGHARPTKSRLASMQPGQTRLLE